MSYPARAEGLVNRIRQLRKLLSGSRRCEIPSLPDTHRVLLDGFTSIAWSPAKEFMVFGEPDLSWLSRFLQPEWKFLKYLVILLESHALSPFPRQLFCLFGWGCRIPLCRGVRPPPTSVPGYDTKQSDGEVPVMLEFWRIRSDPSLPSLPGPLWPRVVAHDRALSMG